MNKKRKLFVAKIALLLSVIPMLLFALQSGPDPGVNGVPGESICTQSGCHVGTANSGPGSVTVDFEGGLTYSPGVKKHVVVTVADPNQRRWGFQLTARLAGSGANAKTQAGTFAPAGDGFTQVICASNNLLQQSTLVPCPANLPLQYIEHTEQGARLGQMQSARFEFDWTPPAGDVGPITIYVAANAANGDRQPAGDRIYARTYDLTPAATGGNKPTIDENGVVNFWGNEAAISEASFVTIRGSGFGGQNTLWDKFITPEGQLPTSLDGISVKMANQDAFVKFAGDTRLTLLAPNNLGAGLVPVQVTTAAGDSNTVMVEVQQFAPAFCNLAGLAPGSEKYIGAFVLEADGTYTRVGPPGLLEPLGIATRPAKPGETVRLCGTGWGPTEPTVPSGQVVSEAARMTNTVDLTIGGVPVEFLDNGYLVSAGEYQFDVRIPDVTSGGDLPVAAQISGVPAQGSLVIAIEK